MSQNALLKKVRYLIRADSNLLRSKNIRFNEKATYIARKYKNVLLNKRKIKYFDKSFAYDNRFAPILLSEYPKEIEEIDEIINFKKIKNILDIGANIGQWGFTIKSLYGDTNIYSFEPNHRIFDVLKANSSQFRSWKTFNVGVGKRNKKEKLYFSKEASAEASVYAEHTLMNFNREIEEIPIKIINLNKTNQKKLGIPRKVGLVKIDVEGYEEEVLQGIKELDFDYLYLELPYDTIEKIEDYKKKLNKLYKSDFEFIECFHQKDSKLGNFLFLRH